MRRLSTIIVLALCALLFASLSSAQQTSATAATTTASVPNLIRYSGTLKDGQGAALASTVPVGVTFAIYNQEDGGAAVWQETQNITPERNGQYSVILGSTTAAGLPDDLFSQQEQRWLGVQVQGQEEQARVLLVSVPYAFKAHEADTLGGMPASAFIKVPSSDTSNGTSLNALSSVAPASPPVIANCAGVFAGYIPVWIPPLPNLCNSVIFQNPLNAVGNIGIGTITPAAKLEVNGNINLTNSIQGYQIAGNTILATDNSRGDSIFAGVRSGGGGGSVSVGYEAGLSSSGSNNVSIGWESNLSGGGNENTYVGWEVAGIGNGGSQNIFIGAGAGYTAEESSNDIFIGVNAGSQGALMNDVYINATCFPNCDLDHPENNTTRIGTLQTDAYMAGVYNSTIGAGAIVCVDATGKLGTNFPSCDIPLQAQIKTQMKQLIAQQQQQIESLQKQNMEFQQRLSRLESLVANR